MVDVVDRGKGVTVLIGLSTFDESGKQIAYNEVRLECSAIRTFGFGASSNQLFSDFFKVDFLHHEIERVGRFQALWSTCNPPYP